MLLEDQKVDLEPTRIRSNMSKETPRIKTKNFLCILRKNDKVFCYLSSSFTDVSCYFSSYYEYKYDKIIINNVFLSRKFRSLESNLPTTTENHMVGYRYICLSGK